MSCCGACGGQNTDKPSQTESSTVEEKNTEKNRKDKEKPSA